MVSTFRATGIFSATSVSIYADLGTRAVRAETGGDAAWESWALADNSRARWRCQDVGSQLAQPGMGCAERFRDRWIVHGLGGVCESIPHLHGAHRAGS